MKEKNSALALISLLSAFLLGGLFIYLFTWKEPGLSYLVYFTIVLSISFVPVIIFEPARLLKERSLYLIIFPAIALLASIFLYRLNSGWIFLAFITMPFICTIYLMMLHLEGTLANFGIFSYLILPFKMFIAWFVDLLGLLKSISLKTLFGRNSKMSSWLFRIALGLVVALPFALFFLVLLGMADSVFADKLGGIIDATLGTWFKDFESFISFMGKLIVGGLVAIYFSVFNFSLWSGESKLKEWMAKNIKPVSDMKKNLDVIFASTFLFVLNVVFVSFVAIQFLYFFGGSDNVIGSNAGFTYAEYARKGFWELLFVSIVAYFLILVLNLKVHTKGIIQKLVFYFNYIVIVLCVLIMNYSSHVRLSLYEEVYGFTVLRFIVHLTIYAIAIQYFFVLISPLIKKAHRFISITTALLVFVFYVVLIVVPVDYVVANENLQRFRETNYMDIAYLLRLSDEAIPVMVDISDELPNSMKYVVMDELYLRYTDMKEKRTSWVSFNIAFERNKSLLEELFETDTDWKTKAQEELDRFISDYVRYVKMVVLKRHMSNSGWKMLKRQDLLKMLKNLILT